MRVGRGIGGGGRIGEKRGRVGIGRVGKKEAGLLRARKGIKRRRGRRRGRGGGVGVGTRGEIIDKRGSEGGEEEE